MDPSHYCVGPRVKMGEGTVLLPGTILQGKTVIGRDYEVGPSAMVRNYIVRDGVAISASQLNESTISNEVKVDPFAYIRPNCHVGPDTKVSNFMELKNFTIGESTKVSRLMYAGDPDVGDHVGLGCGTVMVNYDGTSKFRTVIDDYALIGCNTSLVTPVQVGEGAYTTAGNTITDEMSADSLIIARTRRTIKKQ